MPSANYATFPTATKAVYYEIDGKLFEKLNQRDAIDDPEAIRAVYGDSIGWFKPTGIATKGIDRINGMPPQGAA